MIRALSWSLIALLLFADANLAADVAERPVTTDAGLLQGLRVDDLVVYKGVPFAAPPVGQLRWREPQPVSPWRGTRRADAFAPACMQKGGSMPGEVPPAVSEDCLYLNIWVPAARSEKHLPVCCGFTAADIPMDRHRCRCTGEITSHAKAYS